MATLADSKLKTGLHSDWVDKLATNGDVVTRHSHLNLAAVCIGELIDVTGDIGGAEVELRTITGEERCVTAAFVLGQNVNLTGELLVRSNATWLAENLTALNILALNATKQDTNVIASLAEVHGLTDISIPVATEL